MSKEQLLEEINEIFRNVFIDETLKITENSCAEDIEDWDSLMQITLISEIEKKYSIEFSLKDVQGMKNVGDMLNIILSKKNE